MSQINYAEWYDVMEFLRTLDRKPMEPEQNECHQKRYHEIAQLALTSKNGYLKILSDDTICKYWSSFKWEILQKLVHFGEQHGYQFMIDCKGEDGNLLIIKKEKRKGKYKCKTCNKIFNITIDGETIHDTLEDEYTIVVCSTCLKVLKMVDIHE